MAKGQTARTQSSAVFGEHQGVKISRIGKDAEIENAGAKYPAKWTARSSQTDSPQIPISFKAVDTLKKAHSESQEVALLYTWIEESGAIFAIGLTVNQHTALTQEKVQVNDGESLMFTQAAGGYYIRRHASHQQWEQYCTLADQGAILFTLEVPAPIVRTPSRA